MSHNVRQLVEEHHVYYEVLPYYVVIEEGHGSAKVTTHRIQAGFDVDVHGLHSQSELGLPSTSDYTLGYTELKKVAESVSHLAADSSVEVMPFASTVFLEASKHFHPGGMIRIRISHRRGLDQPAGLPEHRALQEVEKQLQALGIARR
jgi:acetylornithine deacetylase/succinyl-diaminopimelate desuccinylase-like protein